MNLRTKILVTAGAPFLVLLVLVSALLLHLLYDARRDAVQNSIRAEATGLALALEGQNKSTVDRYPTRARGCYRGCFSSLAVASRFQPAFSAGSFLQQTAKKHLTGRGAIATLRSTFSPNKRREALSFSQPTTER